MKLDDQQVSHLEALKDWLKRRWEPYLFRLLDGEGGQVAIKIMEIFCDIIDTVKHIATTLNYDATTRIWKFKSGDLSRLQRG